MEHQGLLSVIIPIYKVESYLEQCIQSVVQQTYEALEIILVDDGSPDQCPRICDSWAQKDKRVRVIHKENGGLSDARNAGMRIACGEFIAFLDSDDWIAPTMYEQCLRVMRQSGAEIAAVNVFYAYENGEKKPRNPEVEKELYSNAEAMELLIEERIFQQTVWNKVYQKNVLEDIEFPKGKLNEDEFWSYLVFAKAHQAGYINEPLYFYRQREGSIMNVFSNRRLAVLEARMQRYEFLQKKYPEFVQKEKLRLYQTGIYFYQCVLQMEDASQVEEGKRIVRGYLDCLEFSKDELKQHGMKVRMMIQASKKNLDFYCKLHKIV